ncbi:hypothetical protein T492DRAFT_837032 [Pavlovales sp. CCMP2436]|nr:hypothetical protein T492DRAFT_837032 [Pavlovales sp. CCMP2436]
MAQYHETNNRFGSFYVNRNIGTDPSKNSLGLLPTNNAFNPSRGSNMAPIQFENVAQVAYFRGGVKKDGRNRIEAELLVTGSNAAVQRQIKYDITRFVDEQNTIIMPYDPKLIYTLFVNSANQIVFFAGASEVKRVLEKGVLATIYTQIYRPVIHFGQKNIQASKSKNVNFQGIYAQAANGVSIDVVNMIERLDSEVFSTDQQARTRTTRTLGGCAFDKRADTFWGSAEGTYTAEGTGPQHLTLEYPTPVELASYRFLGSNRYPGTTVPTQWTISDLQSHGNGSADGKPMSMIGSPMAWDFYLMLTKNGRIVNTGLYQFSSTGLVKTS